ICWFLIGFGYWFFSVRLRRRNQSSMTKRLAIWFFIVTPLAAWLLPGIVLWSFFLGLWLAKVAAGLAGVALVMGIMTGFLSLLFGLIPWGVLPENWRRKIANLIGHLDEMP